MYKLVILIEPPTDINAFESQWPEFLHLVEAMPGLRKEATSRIEQFLYGATPYYQMHELFFDTQAAAEQSLASPSGQAAGRLLQLMTGGRMTLYFADHREDDLAHIQRFKQDSRASG
jgi:uncharacterized protein (TIGR02118 family)